MPNEDGLYTKEEWSGLLTDKQNEVKGRQDLQAKNAVISAEIDKLNATIKELRTPKKAIENPTEVVTRAEMADALEKQKNELTQGYQSDKEADKKANRETVVDNSFDKAREKYTLEAAGKGLTFDEVWEGTKRQIAEDKALGTVIFNAKNPGEKAYKLGLQDAVIAKRKALMKKNFKDPKVTPKIGLEGNEVPGQFFSQERVKKMSRADIAANLPAIRESQKKWNKQ